MPKPEVTGTQTGDDERFSAKFDFCTERIRFGLQHFDWEEFCDTMFERSLRDIQRLIKLAIADAPQAAREQGRSTARASMWKTRSSEISIGAAGSRWI